MNNTLQTRENLPIVDQVISSAFKRELKAALPDGVNIQRYAQGVKTTLLMANGAFDKCTPMSILKCVLTAAQLDLEVDAKGHAYLIPFGNTCQLIPGFKGYLKKIQENSIVGNIMTQVVYNGDKFEVKAGTSPEIIHNMNVEAHSTRSQDQIIFVYAVLNYKSGLKDFEVMSRSEIEEIRLTAKTQNIWSKYFGEMARKTVVRRFAKRLQLPNTSKILEVDDMHSQGFIANMTKDGDIVTEEKIQVTEIIKDDLDQNKKLDKIFKKYIEDKKHFLTMELFNKYIMGITGKEKLKDLNTEERTQVYQAIKKDEPSKK